MADRIFTKKEAKDLTRKEQLIVLGIRKIATSRKDREPDLIRKILASNPEIKKEKPKKEKKVEEVPKVEEVKQEVPKVKEEVVGVSCLRCGAGMELTDKVNKRYKCPVCAFKFTDMRK